MGVGRLIGGAAVAGVAVFAGVGSLGDETTRDDNGDIIESGGLGVYSFQIGDCIQLSDVDLVESVEGLPCADPHDAQVYSEFELTTDAYPGDDAASTAAGEGCYQRFEAAVGVPYQDEPDLAFTAFFPTQDSWDQGDREVTCLLVRVDNAPWTGSGLLADRT